MATTTGTMRGVLMAAVTAGFCAAGGSAGATETTGVNKLDLEVVGHISPSCTMAGGGDIDFGNLNRSGLSATAALALNCNLPFDLKVTSANGGLANVEAPRGQGPYAGLVPYQMSIDVPVRDPAARTMKASYSSAQLRSGPTLSSGEGVAFDGARVRFDLAAPTGAGLLAGNYSEIVEVTVTPRT